MTPYFGFGIWGGPFLKLFLESTQKVRQGLFSSFWSYEPPFRQEGGEGEVVTDKRTNRQTNKWNFHS